MDPMSVDGIMAGLTVTGGKATKGAGASSSGNRSYRKARGRKESPEDLQALLAPPSAFPAAGSALLAAQQYAAQQAAQQAELAAQLRTADEAAAGAAAKLVVMKAEGLAAEKRHKEELAAAVRDLELARSENSSLRAQLEGKEVRHHPPSVPNSLARTPSDPVYLSHAYATLHARSRSHRRRRCRPPLAAEERAPCRPLLANRQQAALACLAHLSSVWLTVPPRRARCARRRHTPLSSRAG